MAEVTLLCFLQGVEEPFRITIDKTDTIEEFKQSILHRVTVIINEVDILRKDRPELKGGKLLKDKLNITSIGKVLDNYIQVFIGNPNSAFISSSLESIDDRVRELENMIKNERLDEAADVELRAIRVNDEFWIKKDYVHTQPAFTVIHIKKPIDVRCRVIEVGNTGRLRVILLREDAGREQKTVSSLLSLEKWLLDCFGLPIMYRNKSDIHLRDYLKVERDGVNKSFKQLYGDYINNL
ncbi:hypothetical protein C1646_668455 [Rhizophagus diaphanus]|nr:hypothetical protein C1646_668455 [Rhizophagus diaphanus] [Rhizophagus sp. MUCL 43196]